MYSVKRIYIITLISLLVSQTCGKKTKWSKRPTQEIEETTPIPNVVTYSNFGFNDVSSYDGFVPSSPDYATYLSNNNQETSTRLYAPAFPTAMDNNGYENYGQERQESQSFPGTGGEGGEQTSMLQYDPSSAFNYANKPSFVDNMPQTQSQHREDGFEQNDDYYNAPVYGTKLGSKGHRNRPNISYNSSAVYENSGYSDEKYSNFNDVQSQPPQQALGESASSSNNYYTQYAPNYQPMTNVADEAKSSSGNAVNSVKFNKVVDFTKYKPSYPTAINNIYASNDMKPINAFNNQNEMPYSDTFYETENEHPTSKYNEEQGDTEKSNLKPIGTNVMEFSVSHVDNTNNKNSYQQVKSHPSYKNKLKTKPSYDSEQHQFFNDWKNSLNKDYYNETQSGYTPRRPLKNHVDDIPASSNNVIDFTNYKYPDPDFSALKKLHDYKPEASDNYPSVQPIKYQNNFVENDNEYYNQLRNLYSSTQSSSTQWGTMFKGSDTSPSRSRPKQLQPLPSDDDVVHIPKRSKYHIKQKGKQSEWHSSIKHGPYKSKHADDWNKELPNRFKNEEDLLGLRNHDTSHPQYLPNYKMISDPGEDYKNYMSDGEYKSLVEKWRQSYMKSKYKDSLGYRDTDAYGSETRPMHVPVPKPYPIEVPRPVIVPVPQPYPVRVPVPKPVAVPVIREITVPIEKPIPYPVVRKVPYPIEKPVPVPVEKEVKVPVMKPYAVPVPHVRPVFHHSRPAIDEMESERDLEHDEFDYMPHPPENGYKTKKHVKSYKASYKKRARRPSISTYYERNRRRWPHRRPPSTLRQESSRTRKTKSMPPSSSSYLRYNYAPRHKYSTINSFGDQDFEEVEHDQNLDY